MPLIYENQEKMRKLFTELFLIFEELVFPEISRELPPKYVIKKYLYGMLDTTGKAFVKSTIAKSIFDKDTSQKIVEIIMNREMECDDQKKMLKEMNVATMGGG